MIPTEMTSCPVCRETSNTTSRECSFCRDQGLGYWTPCGNCGDPHLADFSSLECSEDWPCRL